MKEIEYNRMSGQYPLQWYIFHREVGFAQCSKGIVANGQVPEHLSLTNVYVAFSLLKNPYKYE